MMNSLEKRAKQIATQAHEGQYRNDNTPYIVHPAAVVKILKDAGITDEETIVTGWLHDVVEDSEWTVDRIREEFGDNVALYTQTLSRTRDESIFTDTDAYKYSDDDPRSQNDNKYNDLLARDQQGTAYKSQIWTAPQPAIDVKLADMVDNTKDISPLSPTGMRRKIRDAYTTYIPLAKQTNRPQFARRIEENLLRLYREHVS